MAGQDKISALHKAARNWASAGFYCFPCTPGAKTPACKNGLDDATTDLEQIDRWWAEANYNIGVSPAHTADTAMSMYVLDVDPPLGAETLARLELEHGALPPTLTIRTPRGGRHYWFAGSCPSTVGKLGPKLDTRSRGGYVLVPPSIVNGVEYTYESETNDIADGPSWVGETIANARASHDAAEGVQLDLRENVDRARLLLRQYVEAGDVAVEGQGGDSRTYQVSCEVLNIGLTPQTAWNVIREEWNPSCIPPWDEDELAVKVQNAAEYSQNQIGAWAVPPSPDIFAHVLQFAATGAENKPVDLRKSKFYPRAMDELDIFKPPEWLVPGLIPKNGTVQIIGKQKSFKTFLALDLALGIASGTRTFGQTPEKQPVVYAVGENADSVALNHVPAWREARGQQNDFPFFIVPALPRAMWSNEAEEFITSIKARGVTPSVVVIDTMTRSMRGLDENSARDMGMFSDMCEAIQRSFNCTVIVIRHTGKDESRGGRGSNVVEGDFDTTLHVERYKKTLAVAVHVREQRNAPEPEVPFTFQGEVLNLSLVFHETDTHTHDALMREDDPFERAKIGAALRELAALSRETSITTLVLATHLCPPLQNDSREAQERAVGAYARQLGKLAKDRLAGYVEGYGRTMRWFLPALADATSDSVRDAEI